MSELITRPLLAATADDTNLEKVDWPALCSPKVDGIRCLVHPTLGPVTRSFKSLPNAFVRTELERLAGGSNLDGELMAVDSEMKALEFNDTQSAMMSHGGSPRWVYVVFDSFIAPYEPFELRLNAAFRTVKEIGVEHIRFLPHRMIPSMEAFIDYAETCTINGFEGAMIRHPNGAYKSGRSTFNQGILLKYKNWVDAEGVVIGFEEMLRNANPDQGDEFGLAKRSSHKVNMIPAGVLGNLILQTEWGELRVGSGFDMSQRDLLWKRNVTELDSGAVAPDLGRKVTFKYQSFGMKALPRFPIFKSFREEE